MDEIEATVWYYSSGAVLKDPFPQREFHHLHRWTNFSDFSADNSLLNLGIAASEDEQ
jgi:hypothetical protein